MESSEELGDGEMGESGMRGEFENVSLDEKVVSGVVKSGVSKVGGEEIAGR